VTPVDTSQVDEAFVKGRRTAFQEVRALAPHEVGCRCEHGGEYEMALHTTGCPRRDLHETLKALEGEWRGLPKARFFELSPADARLLVGDLSDYGGSASAAMPGMLALDSRMRVFLGKDPEPDKATSDG
jgi:hypothetical protein